MKSTNPPPCRPESKPRRCWTCVSVFVLLLVAGAARAQESLRNSMAGDAAAEAARQQIASQLYTYKAGDFRLLVVPSVEMDYNDNVNVSKTNAQSDFILKPLVQLTGSYPLTQQNLLSLSVGVGYDEYLEHGSYSALRLNSDSLLSFDMYIKDFWINFHDRFSFFEDPERRTRIDWNGHLRGVRQHRRSYHNLGFGGRGVDFGL